MRWAGAQWSFSSDFSFLFAIKTCTCTSWVQPALFQGKCLFCVHYLHGFALRIVIKGGMEFPFSICLHGTGFSGRNVMLPAFPAAHSSWGKITSFFLQSCQGDCLECPGHPPAGGVAELPWTLQFPVGEWIFHSTIVRTTVKPSSALKESFPLPGCGIWVSPLLWHFRSWVCVQSCFCHGAEWKLPVAFSDSGNSCETIKFLLCSWGTCWEHVCDGWGLVGVS